MPKGKSKKPAVAKGKAKSKAEPKTNGEAKVEAIQAQAPKLVRQNKKTQAIEPRAAGRPHPDYEYGYTLTGEDFHVGNPPKAHRKPGRPAGSKNARAASTAKAAPSSALTGAAKELNRVVEREVNARIKTAYAAAMSAFKKALQ